MHDTGSISCRWLQSRPPKQNTEAHFPKRARISPGGMTEYTTCVDPNGAALTGNAVLGMAQNAVFALVVHV